MPQLFIHEGTVALNKFISDKDFIAISVPAFTKMLSPSFISNLAGESIWSKPFISKKISPVLVLMFTVSPFSCVYSCNSNSSAGEEKTLWAD